MAYTAFKLTLFGDATSPYAQRQQLEESINLSLRTLDESVGSRLVPLALKTEVQEVTTDLNRRVPVLDVAGGFFVPLVVAGRLVPVWLEKGLLGAKGLTPELIASVNSQIVKTMPQSGDMVALFVEGRKVPVWLKAGEFDVAKVSKSFIQKIKDGLDLPAPYVPPTRPYSTGDTLRRFRAKKAGVKRNVTGAQLKILMVTDSWGELPAIPKAIADVLVGGSANLAYEGYLPFRAGYSLNPTGFSQSTGWAYVDSTTTTNWPYGIGPDGTQIYTTATNASARFATLRCTSFKIYRHEHGGTWRYRVDAGAWVVVNDGNSGQMTAVSVTGLTDASHDIQIDTAGNTGVVAMDGISYTRAGATGVVLSRLSKGGAFAARQALTRDAIRQVVRDLQPDLMITLLGTNDQFGGSSVDAYGSHLTALANMMKEEVGNGATTLFLMPALSNGTRDGSVFVPVPLRAYRDRILQIAPGLGAEYLDLIDLMGSFAEGDALGLWADWGHLNDLGGRVAADLLNDNLLKM